METELVERVKEVLAADVAKFRAWLQEECDGEVCARTHMCARTRTYALIRALDNRTRLPKPRTLNPKPRTLNPKP